MPYGYRWPDPSDFWFTGVTACIFMALEKTFETLFYPWYYEKVCKEKKNLVMRELRSRKAVQNMFKAFYYTLALIFGYLTLKDSYILPPALGGSGSFYN